MYTKQEKRMQVLAHTVMTLISLAAVLPFILLVMASFTDNETAMLEGYRFFPSKFSLAAYEYIINEWGTIGRAYGMTIAVTVLGTAAGLLITSLFAYALSQKDLPGRKLLTVYVIFTMLFNGGIVSGYLVWTKIFQIKNTFFALLVPNLLMNAFNLILMRNYFSNSIPTELLEAPRIDGAGEWKIFAWIVIPLSRPILATVGMMYALGYWNDWTNGLYFLDDRYGSRFYSIQNVLNRINENISFLANNSSQMGQMMNTSQLPTNTMRMAIAVVGILPILIAYPFFQKYFVKGITIGSVKG